MRSQTKKMVGNKIGLKTVKTGWLLYYKSGLICSIQTFILDHITLQVYPIIVFQTPDMILSIWTRSYFKKRGLIKCVYIV